MKKYFGQSNIASWLASNKSLWQGSVTDVASSYNFFAYTAGTSGIPFFCLQWPQLDTLDLDLWGTKIVECVSFL